MENRRKTSEPRSHGASSPVRRARDEETLRHTSELYEDLGRELSTLRMDIWLLNQRRPTNHDRGSPGSVTEKLTATSRLLNSTIHAIKNLSHEIKPLILGQLSVSAIVSWQLQEFRNRSGIEYNLISGADDLSLQPDIGRTVMRILQLILSSIESYQSATLIDVSVRRGDDSFLVLQVSDNGNGITERHIADSQALGLLLMHERTKLLGGDLSITDAPGGGTTFLLKVPLTLEKKKLH